MNIIDIEILFSRIKNGLLGGSNSYILGGLPFNFSQNAN